MKYNILLVLLFMLMTACQPSEVGLSSNQESQIKAEIETVFQTFSSSAKNLDHDLYLSFFDENDFSILSADGTTLNSKEAFKTKYLPQLAHIEKYISLEFDPINFIVVDSQNAIIVNEFKAEVVLKNGDIISTSGAGAQFWSKRSGQWKLLHISDSGT